MESRSIVLEERSESAIIMENQVLKWRLKSSLFSFFDKGRGLYLIWAVLPNLLWIIREVN